MGTAAGVKEDSPCISGSQARNIRSDLQCPKDGASCVGEGGPIAKGIFLQLVPESSVFLNYVGGAASHRTLLCLFCRVV